MDADLAGTGRLLRDRRRACGPCPIVNDLRLITSAVSLGHDETLVAYEQYPEARAAAFARPFRDHGLIRLAVGLESANDLVAALTSAYGARR